MSANDGSSAVVLETEVLKPRISIVIPTYNRQELLIEAIESVLAQTYQDFEIIIVDDGSTDETEVRLHPYSSRIHYKKQINRGVAAARNTGIRMARGEFVCFLDSDDLWLPDKLAVQIEFASEHPEYGLIATEIQGIDANKETVDARKSAKYKIRNGNVAEDLLFGNWIQTSTVMVRKRCLEEVGVFDEDVGQFGEDWLMWVSVAAKFPIYFLPQPLVLYRFHSESLSMRQSEAQFHSLMRCLEKLSSIPIFRQKPHLLQKLEYNICMGRAWRDRKAGDYDRAMEKWKRAIALEPFPVRPLYWIMRASAERIWKRHASVRR